MEYMFEGQQGGVTHIEFSKDGKYLYTGGRKVVNDMYMIMTITTTNYITMATTTTMYIIKTAVIIMLAWVGMRYRHTLLFCMVFCSLTFFQLYFPGIIIVFRWLMSNKLFALVLMHITTKWLMPLASQYLLLVLHNVQI